MLGSLDCDLDFLPQSGLSDWTSAVLDAGFQGTAGQQPPIRSFQWILAQGPGCKPAPRNSRCRAQLGTPVRYEKYVGTPRH